MTRDSNGRAGGRVSRRGLLRGVGAASVGVVGVGLGSTTAAAGKGDECEDPPLSFPRVFTRGHFETTWYGSVYITDGNTATNYDYDGDPVPGVGGAAPDELLLHAHGWRNDYEGGICSTSQAGATYGLEGYAHPAVGYQWDADRGWYNATEIAERNGAKLAAFVNSYKAQHPGTTIRLSSHSLGARVVLSAVEHLDAWGVYDAVESVVLLAGAADADAVAMEGQYGPSIERAAGHVENFWMNGDDVLDYAYSIGEWGTAVGAAGCDGTPPANYTDHNVDYVPDHFSHYKEDGCIHEVLATF